MEPKPHRLPCQCRQVFRTLPGYGLPRLIRLNGDAVLDGEGRDGLSTFVEHFDTQFPAAHIRIHEDMPAAEPNGPRRKLSARTEGL